ncbi:hypothetical protein M9Y10_014124 [Tritrichomonas musculus]|uniref:Uncharacterized protein n=1 Tax=Tritrichomonas musculus TaxID=1915356 RepID=A0ABR2KYP5_9EUKA
MQLCNYLVTELMKPKTHYKRLLDMENNVKMYVYGFRDISTKCRTRYLLAVSPDNKLTPTTPLLLYPADRELKDFIYNNGERDRFSSIYEEWYKIDETNKICGRDKGKWCFIIEKHGTAYKKTKNLQPVIDIIDVYDDNDEVYERSHTNIEDSIDMRKTCTDEFFKHKYINSNKLQKIDDIVKEGDVVLHK